MANHKLKNLSIVEDKLIEFICNSIGDYLPKYADDDCFIKVEQVGKNHTITWPQLDRHKCSGLFTFFASNHRYQAQQPDTPDSATISGFISFTFNKGDAVNTQTGEILPPGELMTILKNHFINSDFFDRMRKIGIEIYFDKLINPTPTHSMIYLDLKCPAKFYRPPSSK